MNQLKHKVSTSALIFLFSIISLLSRAQMGIDPQTALAISDAPYDAPRIFNNSDKEQWYRYKSSDAGFRLIMITNHDPNPTTKANAVELYKGSSQNLQLVRSSLPMLQSSLVASIFLDSGMVNGGDSIFLRVTKVRNPCSGCIDNFDINYSLSISSTPPCVAASIACDALAPFQGNCDVSSPPIAGGVICTVKVCAGETRIIDLIVHDIANAAFPSCGSGSISFLGGFASLPTLQSHYLQTGNWHNVYSYTAGNTPGTYYANVNWTYFSANYICNGEPPEPGTGQSVNCHGYFVIEVGPPAPTNNGFTISPNPVCKGQQMCFTANDANQPGWSYLIETGLSVTTLTLSATGDDVCEIYPNAGTYTAALTVYNGFCPSPRLTLPVHVVNPTVTGSFTKNTCRNYNFNASSMCFPADVIYSWNIGGATYTGSAIIIDIPGNASNVPFTLTAYSPSANTTATFNSSVPNVDTYSVSVNVSASCGNVTYLTTPSSCIPADAIYTWSHNGITHVGNPSFTAALNAGATITPNATLTVTNPNGTVLFTQVVNSQNIGPQAPLCCNNNTLCIGDGCAQLPAWTTSFTFTASTSYTGKMITVMPGVKISVAEKVNVTFTNCTFLMFEGSGFIVKKCTTPTPTGGSNFLTFNSCYLRGCDRLWDGIWHDQSATAPAFPSTVNFTNSMIEDALTAFDFMNNSFWVNLTVTKAIFNKNHTGIKFLNSRPSKSTFKILV